jgi:hypothetical protein
VDIDQLLAKHPAPWTSRSAPWTDTGIGYTDGNGVFVDEANDPAVHDLVNAYAAMKAENAEVVKDAIHLRIGMAARSAEIDNLKAENAKYRAAIGHADRMLECEIDGPDFDEARANYDAARKELP